MYSEAKIKDRRAEMVRRSVSRPLLGYRFRFILCLEIAQEPVKSRLVLIVVLPIAEVADVPCAADISSPGLVGLHHSIVKPDRKEHRFPLLFALFLKGSFDLRFYLRAMDRVF